MKCKQLQRFRSLARLCCIVNFKALTENKMNQKRRKFSTKLPPPTSPLPRVSKVLCAAFFVKALSDCFQLDKEQGPTDLNLLYTALDVNSFV
jgi:hypothetical protein